MKLGTLAIAAAALGAAINIASTAFAADMVVKAKGPAYDPCGVARFTGFYVGGNVGAAAVTSNRNDLDGFFTDNAGWTATDIAPTIGAQIGYDWQSAASAIAPTAATSTAS